MDDYLEEFVLLNEKVINMIRKSKGDIMDLSGINTLFCYCRGISNLRLVITDINLVRIFNHRNTFHKQILT